MHIKEKVQIKQLNWKNEKNIWAPVYEEFMYSGIVDLILLKKCVNCKQGSILVLRQC